MSENKLKVGIIGATGYAGAELFSIKLHETAGSYAEWYASDNI